MPTDLPLPLCPLFLSFESTLSAKHTRHQPNKRNPLTVALGHTLQLVLLLDRVRVAAALGGVDQLLSEALGDRLDVAEGRLAGTGGEEGDSLVDAAEGRDVDGLATDGTGRANTGGVFAGTAVDDGVNSDLDGVLVGHEMDLENEALESFSLRFVRDVLWVKKEGAGEPYDLEGVGNDPDSHELLAVVAAVHHERVGKTLNDGAVGLPEALRRILAGGVRDIDGVAEGDVVAGLFPC